MNEQDIELAKAETELQREETALHTEIARLSEQSEQLAGKADHLRAILAEAEAAGARDGTLGERLRKAVLPVIDPGASFERARQFRRASVTARREANQAVRQTLQGWKDHVTHLNEQLRVDEPLVQRLVSDAQKKAEARRAAAKAEAARAAAAQAAAEQEAAEQAMVEDPGDGDGLAQTMLRPAVPELQVEHLSGKRPARAPEAPKDDKKKRTSQRVRMMAAVDLHSDNNFFSGFSANLSDGGLFVATVNLLPIGTEVEVTFTLPDSNGQKIAAHGVVRWRREIDDRSPESFPGLGVQFTSLDESAHEAIGRFLAEREPMFYVD